MIRLVLAAAMVAALPATCGDRFDAPGQVNYRATMTVINRTERAVMVFMQDRTIDVPACGEVEADGAFINTWQVTSPGRDMIHSGGGHSEAHSYLIVTQFATQVDMRPHDLPACVGLLQPAS